MKILNIFVLIFLLGITSAFSQEAETLITGDVEHGGFGGLVIKFTEINNEFGVLVGGRAGWIINHTFSLGGGGYGLTNEIYTNEYYSQRGRPFIQMGYGGLEMEYINKSQNLIHFSVLILIGGGGVDYYYGDKDDWERDNNKDGDSFFVFEPEADVTMNVTNFFRIAAGLSYRFISGVETLGLNDDDFRGVSVGLTLKFGKF